MKVIMANHPFGEIEGILLATLLGEVRNDLKIMANHLLSCFPELHDLMIFVDPFGKDHAIKKNMPTLKEAIRWLQQGRMLTIFPAGEVAHVNLRARELESYMGKAGAAIFVNYHHQKFASSPVSNFS